MTDIDKKVSTLSKTRTLRPRFAQKEVYRLAAVLFSLSFVLLSVYKSDYSILKRTWYSLLVAYLPSYFDGSEYTAEGRYWRAFALSGFWKTLFEYFPASVQFQEPLEQGKQYILSTHPHGLLSAHHGFYFTSRDFDKQLNGHQRRHIGATLVFKIPLFREWMLWGGVVDCGKSVAEDILRSGKSLVALTGGISEQTRSERGKHFIYIRKRKGIFELALRYGIDVVPSYCFGEHDTLYTFSYFSRFRSWLSDLLWMPVCFGIGWGILPIKTPLKCFVGRPIQVSQTQNPTKEQILELQSKYISAIEDIFENHKKECGCTNASLQIY